MRSLSQTLGTIAVVTAIVLNTGCARDRRVLPPIGPSDEIRVTKDGREVNRITDPKAVATVVALVNRYRDGWGVPWYGPPVADTKVVFHADGRAIGDVGIGSDFVTRTEGDFYSRRIEGSELAALRAALDQGQQ